MSPPAGVSGSDEAEAAGVSLQPAGDDVHPSGSAKRLPARPGPASPSADQRLQLRAGRSPRSSRGIVEHAASSSRAVAGGPACARIAQESVGRGTSRQSRHAAAAKRIRPDRRAAPADRRRWCRSGRCGRDRRAASKNAYAVVAVEERPGAARPCAAARARVSGSTMAPAASVGPSMPSVPIDASTAGVAAPASALDRGERELLVAAAASAAAHAHRRLAARDRRQTVARPRTAGAPDRVPPRRRGLRAPRRRPAARAPRRRSRGRARPPPRRPSPRAARR